MFTQADFLDPDIFERLRAIFVVKTNKNIMSKFSSLSLKEKRLANLELNNYIKENLTTETWKDTLIADFNAICREEIFENPKFDYAKLYVPPSEQGADA